MILNRFANLQLIPGHPPDPAGNWKKFTMDAFGNLTTVVEPDASQTNTNNQATTTYYLYASDWHWNNPGTTITVVTPPAGSADPCQTGVRPTGSYWGGGGENIDMRSGNLNFSIPLLKVKGRGWTVPFNLSYNSQNWAITNRDPRTPFAAAPPWVSYRKRRAPIDRAIQFTGPLTTTMVSAAP